MTFIQRHLRLPALAIATLVIASCGGGGGGGSDTTLPSAVSVTTSNAKPISAEILDSAETVQGAAAGPAILTAVSVSPSSADFSYPEFVVQQLGRIQEMSVVPSTLNGAVITATTFDCTISGTWTISGNDADNSGDLTVGDSITLSFSTCVETDVTVNGSMSMTITQLSGDITNPSAVYALGVNVTLTNLSVSVSGHVASSSGDMTMVISNDGSGGESFTLSGSSLSSTVSSQTVTLANYLYDFALSDAGPYTISLQGTLASATIGGSVSYTTITPFTGNEFVGSGDPTAGELHIVGANGSQAWLTAQPDGSTVLIEVDNDGDNVVDTTITTSWSELDSL